MLPTFMLVNFFRFQTELSSLLYNLDLTPVSMPQSWINLDQPIKKPKTQSPKEGQAKMEALVAQLLGWLYFCPKLLLFPVYTYIS